MPDPEACAIPLTNAMPANASIAAISSCAGWSEVRTLICGDSHALALCLALQAGMRLAPESDPSRRLGLAGLVGRAGPAEMYRAALSAAAGRNVALVWRGNQHTRDFLAVPGPAFDFIPRCAPDAPLLAMLPGSRTSEIRLMFPTFRKTVALLAQKIPGLVTVLPTVPHVAAKVRAATENWPTPLHIIENEADKFAAFDAADVAFAASGTVTAEIALSRTPMVVFYILGGLTYALGIWLFNSRFFTLLNVLLDREAAPEFLQAKAKPELMAAELEKLFHDPAARAAQIEAMNEFGRRLGEGEEPPSRRAARVLLDFIK